MSLQTTSGFIRSLQAKWASKPHRNGAGLFLDLFAYPVKEPYDGVKVPSEAKVDTQTAQLILDGSQRALDALDTQVGSLDTKAGLVLTSASLLTTAVGALQVALSLKLHAPPYLSAYQVVEVAALICYLGVVVASGLAYRIRSYSIAHVADAIKAMRDLLGENDMMAYLAMMAPRLIELRRVLKDTGSIYLHCDPTASHYLKVLMDSIFQPVNFRNEVIWYYYNKMHDRRKKLFPRATDTLLFYAKNVESSFTFHQLQEQRESPIRQLARKKVAGKMVNVKDAAGHVVYNIRETRVLDNVWRIPALQPASAERLGYPTQKPVALLERIIQASSNLGDTVLDPFCGCGTAIDAAQKLGRSWVGIDITYLAIGLIKSRLSDSYGDALGYDVIGEPTALPDAQELAADDPYQFQWWALGLVDARPVDQKKGADKGIDGKLYFQDDAAGQTKQVIFSVKAGHTGPNHVNELRGVVERENAAIGVLITMQEPTKAMKADAASAGFYEWAWTGAKFPRLQLLTVAELLGGRRVDMPPIRQVSTTFKKAPTRQKSEVVQATLLKVAEEPESYEPEPDTMSFYAGGEEPDNHG
jgi:site-specific DNA-methyltransferase (adenine-specific)